MNTSSSLILYLPSQVHVVTIIHPSDFLTLQLNLYIICPFCNLKHSEANVVTTIRLSDFLTTNSTFVSSVPFATLRIIKKIITVWITAGPSCVNAADNVETNDDAGVSLLTELQSILQTPASVPPWVHHIMSKNQECNMKKLNWFYILKTFFHSLACCSCSL